MCRHLLSIILLTFIRFKGHHVSHGLSILLVASMFFVPAKAATLKLSNFELSGVIVNNSDSLAVLFDKETRHELVVRVGDVVAGCVLDYIRRSRVNFYCNDDVQTLTLRSLSSDFSAQANKVVWSPSVTLSTEQQARLFDQPADFITEFNLVPYMHEGKLIAYEVRNIPQDEQLTKRLDLQQGDLIVTVNGVSASEPAEFSKAFEQIKFTQSIDVELIREQVRYFKNYLLQR